ncbi:MAG TPA: choice-of-anchor V domain-containing protein [Gemmatimonadales bacterium]
MRVSVIGIVALAGVAGRPRSAAGPPPGHTGGFGEPTCQACHAGAPVNADGGSLTILGWDRATCGERLAVTVRLERPGTRRGGFQLAVRWADGPARGRQAGRILTPDHERVEIVTDAAGIQFAQHSSAATADTAAGAFQWDLTWDPPRCPAAIAVHAAANASNDDDSELGDHVYTASLQVHLEE